MGTGAASAASAAVTPAPAVTLVVLAAARITTAVAGNAQVTLNWAAPASDGGTQITGYAIRTFIGTGTTQLRTTQVGNTTRAALNTLINATTYTFDVAAINSVGTAVRSPAPRW